MRNSWLCSMRQTTLLLCSSLTAASACGCVRTGERLLGAGDPWTYTGVRVEVGRDEGVARGRLLAAGQPRGQECDELRIRPRQSFGASGFNCNEEWMLTSLRNGRARFDVRGRYYACYDPLAIWFGIPSCFAHWTVVVRASDRQGSQTATSRAAGTKQCTQIRRSAASGRRPGTAIAGGNAPGGLTRNELKAESLARAHVRPLQGRDGYMHGEPGALPPAIPVLALRARRGPINESSGAAGGKRGRV
jgi:hypothetical protein